MVLCSGHLFLVTEFVEGGALDTILWNTAPIPWRQRLQYACDVAAGMLHLHKNGLIHRDLKSPNVLVELSGTCKVTDFGLSRVLDGTEEEGLHEDSDTTPAALPAQQRARRESVKWKAELHRGESTEVKQPQAKKASFRFQTMTSGVGSLSWTAPELFNATSTTCVARPMNALVSRALRQDAPRGRRSVHHSFCFFGLPNC